MRQKKVIALIDKYCDLLKIPLSKRPTFKKLEINDTRIEIDYIEGDYWYISNDKVNRFNNASTSDGDELLYWIFSDITFSMAEEKCNTSDYSEQSEYNMDLRTKQLDLMHKLDKKMYKKLKEHHIRLLEILE